MINLKYVSGDKYFDSFVIDIIRKNNGKVCYITLNKSCGSLGETFAKKKFDTKKFYFIDGVTKLLKEPSNGERCKFVLPYELDDMEKYVLEDIRKGCNMIIFDSLSSLLVYQQMIPAGAGILVRFIKSINSELMKKGGKAIFICKSKDRNNVLIKETAKIFR